MILMDCTVSTGAAAMMAVRVLLVSGSQGLQVAGLVGIFHLGLLGTGPRCA